MARWQAVHDSTEQLLQLARGYNGETSTQLMLKPGEAGFATVINAGLIEGRKGARHWEDRSTGVSVPVGSTGGHTIRYHAGPEPGTHYENLAPSLPGLDHRPAAQGLMAPHSTSAGTGSAAVSGPAAVSGLAPG